jgi:anti-sigma factor RsiW
MSDYLDAELVPSGRSRMERHLGECDECRRVLTGLRRMLDALRLLPAAGGVDAAQIVAAVRVRVAEQPRSD